MTDQTTIPRQVPLGKAVLGGVLATALSLLGAYMGSGDGSIVIPQPAPHPAVVARLDGIEHRLAAVERRLEDPSPRQEAAALAAAVNDLRGRIDLYLARDTRVLTEPKRR